MILNEARIRAGLRSGLFSTIALGAAAAALSMVLALPAGDPLPWTIAAGVAATATSYLAAVRPWQLRAAALRRPFPSAWEAALEEHVAYYRALDPRGRERFRRAVQLFLAEKRISGVGVAIDDTARILVAASAVIPVFGLEEWRYRSVVEVLLYPQSFDEDYEVRARRGGMLGMAPSQSSTIILSLPALREGFGPRHGRMHVGIHEFLHAVDGEDGLVDGMPSLLLDVPARLEWERIVAERLRLLERGGTILDLYAAEDEAELFAVAGEHFFLDPQGLYTADRELYQALARMLRQDPARASGRPRRLAATRPPAARAARRSSGGTRQARRSRRARRRPTHSNP